MSIFLSPWGCTTPCIIPGQKYNPGLRRPSAAGSVLDLAEARMARCFADWFTIPPPAGWVAVRGTPASSARWMIFQFFAGCCWQGGAFGQTQILSPATIATMISPSTPLNKSNIRGLGWSIDTTCDDGKGKRSPLPIDHSGFTGTKLWLHPGTGLYIVFLSNRLHPDGKGDVFDLRENIITIAVSVAAGQGTPAELSVKADAANLRPLNGSPEKKQPRGQVLSGLDVLRAEDFNRMRGRKIGLLTNRTGQARDGVSAIDLLAGAGNLELIALFSPEHGIRGIRDDRVPSSRDKKTGRVIHSLYGKRVRPTPEMLAGIDTIVVDLQDIGTRFYTYMTTLAYMLEAAAKQKIKVMVLDRPNPYKRSSD